MPGPSSVPYGSRSAAAAAARRNTQQNPDRIQAVRQFLIRQGYHVPDHGDRIGSVLRSALQDWHSGIHNRNPNAWNKANGRVQQQMDVNPNAPQGQGTTQAAGAEKPEMRAENQAVQNTHKAIAAQDKTAGAKNLPKHNTPPNSPKGNPHGGNGGGGGGSADPLSGISAMLSSMLGHSATAKMLPLSLADQAASPDTALAATLGDQIGRLPAAKARALQNISDWFGQVQGAEKKGAAKDKSLADAGSSAMQDAAKGIMASLGGSAMAGSGEVGAVGANDANTMTAIGANDAALSDELAPIFKLSEANAKNSRSQQYDNQLSDLQDQKGQAQGSADAARAAAVMQILSSNNASRQTNFGNQTGLLNTLAGLQISGANAASDAQYKSIENALHISEIRKNAAGKASGLDAMTPSQKADFVQKIVGGLLDPSSHKLSYDWPTALRNARSYARSAGLNPMGNQVIQQIIGPALQQAGVTGPKGGYWPAIYQP